MLVTLRMTTRLLSRCTRNSLSSLPMSKYDTQCSLKSAKSSDGIGCKVMSDVTHILNAIEAGDTQAAKQLLPLVYDELRRLAVAKMPANNAAWLKAKLENS